jgi:hypothetical protein
LTVHLYGLLVRATKKKAFLVHVLLFLAHRLSIPSSTPQQHTGGADGDPGILFPQNCFFDITFVFLALWSGMLQGFSMALTLNLMIGACFLAFFFSSTVLGRGRNTES